MFGYELVKKEEMESRNEERRLMWHDKESKMSHILDLRMMLYNLYPNDIKKISDLFQMYQLE